MLEATPFTTPVSPARLVKTGVDAQAEVSGTVVSSEDGSPLPGVSVVIKGTATGTATDAQGRFALSVADGNATLVFSYVGFTAREVPLNNRTQLKVTLAPDAKALEEVVVVGYGTQKKSDLTGAIASVTTETLVRGGNNNTLGALQGTVSGVNIVRSNNKPGGGYSIDIRGLSSISSTNTPLIVVDGVPGADLDKINPDDIEKLDILKDASATAIYGSRGANGVVIVTTKRGVVGQPPNSYNINVCFKKYTNQPDMM
jgi:TonB-dependent starch-binding outer membrane protein SusC